IGKLFGNFLRHIHDYMAFEVLNLVEGDAAHDAVAQRLDFDAGFDNRLNVNAFVSSAIEFVDDHVLRNVDQATGQVARVRSLQSGVGQTLAGAVRGNEVLQHGKAFAEVRSDWRFHNFAGRLGHQAAHAGELANLLLRTAGAGVRHNVDGVDDAFLVVVLQGFEHFVRDFFSHV